MEVKKALCVALSCKQTCSLSLEAFLEINIIFNIITVNVTITITKANLFQSGPTSPAPGQSLTKPQPPWNLIPRSSTAAPYLWRSATWGSIRNNRGFQGLVPSPPQFWRSEGGARVREQRGAEVGEGGLREAGGGNGGEVYLEVCPVRMREMDYLKAGCSQIAQRPSI